jgi:hypothetical protein
MTISAIRAGAAAVAKIASTATTPKVPDSSRQEDAAKAKAKDVYDNENALFSLKPEEPQWDIRADKYSENKRPTKADCHGNSTEDVDEQGEAAAGTEAEGQK